MQSLERRLVTVYTVQYKWPSDRLKPKKIAERDRYPSGMEREGVGLVLVRSRSKVSASERWWTAMAPAQPLY